MATSWTRRSFDSAGLTQIPTGRYLNVLQKRVGGGAVMLLIDVSPSMFGQPITEALGGAKQFVVEAVEALYDVGLILWNRSVVAVAEPTADGTPAYELIAQPQFTGDGTDLYPALVRGHSILKAYTGDRVVAIFGDGDLGNRSGVLSKVKEMKGEKIRFVTRGLGTTASQVFESISDEQPGETHVESVEVLAQSIAGMATTLRGQ